MRHGVAAIIALAVLLDAALVGIECIVDGAVADRVNMNLNTLFVEGGHHVAELLLIPDGLAVPVISLTGGGGIWLDHHGAAALGNAIGVDLDRTGRDHVAIELLEVLHGFKGLFSRHAGHNGRKYSHAQVKLAIFLKVSIELAILCRRLSHDAYVGNAGDAVFRSHLLVLVDSVLKLLVRMLDGDNLPHHSGSRIDQVASRLAVCIAGDDAARGIGGIVIDARKLERTAVDPHRMIGNIAQHDGLIGADLIENGLVGAGIGAILLLEGVDHERAANVSLIIGMLDYKITDHLLILIDRGALGKIDLVQCGHPVARSVDMAVHKAGGHHTAIKIDDARVVIDVLVNTGVFAYIYDLVARDSQGGRGVALFDHRLNRAVTEDDGCLIGNRAAGASGI